MNMNAETTKAYFRMRIVSAGDFSELSIVEFPRQKVYHTAAASGPLFPCFLAPAFLFPAPYSLFFCRTIALVSRLLITAAPPPLRRSILLNPSGAQFDGGHLGNRRLHKASAENSNPAAQLRRNGLVRRVALHHWLSAFEFLERRSGHLFVALLFRRPRQHVDALTGT